MSKKLRYIPWTVESAQPILNKRISDAMLYRQKSQESTWRLNEQTLFAAEGVMTKESSYIDEAVRGTVETDLDPNEAEGFDAFGINYTVRYYRLIQAQLSANPPSVTPTPLTADNEDSRRAKAADDIVKYALRQYELQEEFDLLSAQVVAYGTAYMKTYWNELEGEPLEFDPETLEITKMEGDMDIKCVDTWDVFIDPLAKKTGDVRFIIQRKKYTESEIKAYWPEHWDKIQKAPVVSGQDVNPSYADRYRNKSEIKEQQYVIYEYWEKGLPENAFQGRYVEAMLEDGTCLTPPMPNPHRFAPSKDKLPIAQLPYHIITDIDVTNQVYGNTFITYLTKQQDTLNRLDLQVLENVRAHGVTRMVLPEGAKLAGDAPTNSSFDVVEYSGGNGERPSFVSPPSSMPDLVTLRANIMQGMQDVAGTNESMFGQQSRETSGFSMQYATNQGNLIRRRLFNKYVKVTEGVYNDILEMVKKYWTEERLIQVEGQEGAFNAKVYKGSDISGGYDLVVQYGTSFSLDPMTRRQEIMQLMPLYEKAGRPMDELIKYVKLNDIDSMDEVGQLSENRMREDIDTMIIREELIRPKDWQNHEFRLKFLARYLETAEFDRLPLEKKELILEHKKLREEMLASDASGGTGGGQPAAQAEMPQEAPVAEGAPPMDASMAPAGPAPM